MQASEITTIIKKHIVKNDYLFYHDMLNVLKNYDVINEIPNNKYVLEAIRLYLCYNENKYNVYISYDVPTDLCYRKLELTKKQLNNLFSQCNAINNNKFEDLCLDHNIEVKNDPIYVIFSKNGVKDFIFKSKYVKDIAGVILGIDSFYFLRHQNMERLCKMLESNNNDIKVVNELYIKYYEINRDMDFVERERIMIFSGMIAYMLGTTWTTDIDALVIRNENESYSEQLNRLYKDVLNDFDYHVLTKNNIWIKKSGTILKYQSQWLTYSFPQLVGARDIYEVLTNPEHHFYFMGMKFISVNMNLQRARLRGSLSSLVDLIMYKELNDIDIIPKPCIPNMSINQGRVKVYIGDFLSVLHKIVQGMLYKWYGKKMSLDEIKDRLKECRLQEQSIYRGKVPSDPDTDNIKRFHTMVKKHYILKYCNNCDSLLDIGSGRLRDLDFWNNARIKHVVAIEPSKDSVKQAIHRIVKRKYKVKVNVINGYGDESWNETKYKQVYQNKPYDCITFQFTIHYMFKNMNILMSNLASVSKKGTKVLVMFVDGDYVYDALQKNNGRIEVRNEQEPIFGIYTLYKDRKKKDTQVLVYFKGTYGVQAGSLEYLMFPDDLKDIFYESGFDLVEQKNFLELELKEKDVMTDIQKQVSKFYVAMIFEKN